MDCCRRLVLIPLCRSPLVGKKSQHLVAEQNPADRLADIFWADAEPDCGLRARAKFVPRPCRWFLDRPWWYNRSIWDKNTSWPLSCSSLLPVCSKQIQYLGLLQVQILSRRLSFLCGILVWFIRWFERYCTGIHARIWKLLSDIQREAADHDLLETKMLKDLRQIIAAVAVA